MTASRLPEKDRALPFAVKREHEQVRTNDCHVNLQSTVQGPVVRSLVSANRWLRGIKTYRFPWYLTLVSANHASSNSAQ